MAGVTYASIQPLLESSGRTGCVLRCVFRCPASGKSVEASAPIGDGDGFRNTIPSFVAGILQSVLGQASSASGEGAEHEAAVMGAFRKVADQFVWDGVRWVAVGDELPRDRAEFERRLREAPIETPAGRRVLARMLVEIAKADRELLPEERTFLGEVLDPNQFTIEELAREPALTSAELGATTPGVGQTMLMLSWAVALCDRDLALAEVSRLNVLAKHLGIADETAEVLRLIATGYILQEALEHAYRSGSKDEVAYGDVLAFATMAGVSPEGLEQAESDVAARAKGS